MEFSVDQLRRERLRVVLTAWFDVVLSVLGLLFLAILIVEFAFSPAEPWATGLAIAQFTIWGIFVAAFLVELAVSPSRGRYLREHWLVALSLALPLLRVFRALSALRLLRGVRAARGLALARLFTTTNRAIRSMGELLRVSQFVYLLLLTLVFTLSSAAATFFFERGAEGAGIGSFPEALWWATNVVMTSDGPSQPVTLEGRLVAVALRLFGLAVFGYLTARIAVFFLRRPDSRGEEERASLRNENERLRAELSAARRDSHPGRRAAGERRRRVARIMTSGANGIRPAQERQDRAARSIARSSASAPARSEAAGPSSPSSRKAAQPPR